MELKKIAEMLDLQIKCSADNLDREVKGGYVGDLLSDCLAHCKEGDIWITLQIHQNIVAIAAIKNISAIIIINGREPEAEAVAKASAEGVPIFVSSLSAFEVVGKLYSLGVSGAR